MKSQSAYRNIFKNTSLFGVVQLITIVVALIRSKLIAVLLGPSGMGLFGLFNSTIQLIVTYTDLGIARSAVRNLAEQKEGVGQDAKIYNVKVALRLLVPFLGVTSAAFLFIFSEQFSIWTFDSKEFDYAFKWLSIAVAFNHLTASEQAILRGIKKLRYIAIASLLGSVVGLIASVPLFFLYGQSAIVPSIIISSVLLFILNTIYVKKSAIAKTQINRLRVIDEGKDMIKMGVVLSLSTIFIATEAYIVRIFIQDHGTLDDVGFFGAGLAIINTYFGLFFVSITTEFYPRLTSVANKFRQWSKLILQQSEITLLLISPFLIIFIVFIKPIIIILYSESFTPVANIVIWASLGIFFKASSYAMGVIYMAKGHTKVIFWTELFSTSILLVFNLYGYYYYGLEGLGVSFMLGNIYSYIQTVIVLKFKYNFNLTFSFYKIFVFMIATGALSIYSTREIIFPYNYLVGVILIVLTVCISYLQLNSRMDLSGFLRKFLNKSK